MNKIIYLAEIYKILLYYERGNQLMWKKLFVILLSLFIATSVVGCGDEPGEDEIGDGEVND